MEIWDQIFWQKAKLSAEDIAGCVLGIDRRHICVHPERIALTPKLCSVQTGKNNLWIPLPADFRLAAPRGLFLWRLVTFVVCEGIPRCTGALVISLLVLLRLVDDASISISRSIVPVKEVCVSVLFSTALARSCVPWIGR